MVAEFSNTLPQAQAHFHRGCALFEEENYQDAAGEFLLAIRASSQGFVEAEKFLGYSYRQMASTLPEFVRAIEQFEKVLELDPNDPVIWTSLALLAEVISTDRERVAEEISRESFQQTLNRGGMLSLMGHIHTDQKFRGQAKKLRQVADRASAEAKRRLATFSPAGSNKANMAHDLLNEANALAEFYQETGQTNKAQEWYRLISRIDTGALQEASDEEKASINELRAQAARRQALLEEETRHTGELKSTKWKKQLFIAGGALLLLFLSCSVCGRIL